MFYLTSCSIVKNESKYIYDFYKIHKHLGVEFFLFYDRSTEGPPLTDIFKNHPDVQIIHFPEGPSGRHAHAWQAGIKYFQNKSKWTAFIDIDEVIVPLQHDNIPSLLQRYEAFPALGLNWHTFGSSQLESEPDISTYQAYTWRSKSDAPINTHIQSIVQPNFILPNVWSDPHHPPLPPNLSQVNERFEFFKGPFNNPVSQNVGFIAHYYTRSRDYWTKKISKLRADTGTPGGTMADFDHHQSYMNEVQDFSIKNIWDKIK